MRIAIIVAFILTLIAGLVFFLGLAEPGGGGLTVATTGYDADADGTIDLSRRRIGEVAVLWQWDRDGDGEPEVVGYDSAVDANGALHPTGQVTAWDIGNDGVLDEGEVPVPLQDILRGEALQAAMRDPANPAVIELVDMRTREFVGQLEGRYDTWRLSRFKLPILGAKLPDDNNLLPGARRAYRFGIHQGFDMYEGHVGVPTGYGAPVIASRSGTVVRADTDYQEMSNEQYDQAIATSRAAGTTPPSELDLLRGRQVWIDHGHGIVTRYCHLSGIANDVLEGQPIDGGTIVGFVGNSGMESATQGSRSGAHLHFELRIDGSYLGEGLSPDEIRARGGEIFGLQQ